MFIGILRLSLRIDEAYSLKDRRRVVNSLKDRINKRFNAAAAELPDEATFYNLAHIAVAVVSGEHRHCDEQVQEILNFIEKHGEYVLGDVSTEILSL